MLKRGAAFALLSKFRIQFLSALRCENDHTAIVRIRGHSYREASDEGISAEA